MPYFPPQLDFFSNIFYIVVLDSGEDGLIPAASGVFVSAGSKKLQQSSNYLPEEEGVKFLPVKR